MPAVKATPPSKKKTRQKVLVVHTQACTGGTLLSRCLASQKDFLVVNEISPNAKAFNRFNGLDPIEQLLARTDTTFQLPLEKRVDLFRTRLELVLDHARKEGQVTVLREHSHSETMQATLPDVTLLQVLEDFDIDLSQLMLVRYPLASYMTARDTGFLKDIANLDIYAGRYKAFLELHKGVEQIRYEDFTYDPNRCFQKLCSNIGVAFEPADLTQFWRVQLAGNSGRYGDLRQIRPTLLRSISKVLSETVSRSSAFVQLCIALKYAPDAVEYAIGAARRVLAFDPNDPDALEFLKAHTAGAFAGPQAVSLA